jgi:hypothetical protein
MPQGWTDFAPPQVWPWLLICAGVVGLAVLILLIKLITQQRTPAEVRTLSPAQQRTLERDVSNLIAALSEMAQAVGSELDERAVRLEKLLAAADERIERLHELSNRREIAAPPPTPAPVNDSRHMEIYTLADKGLSSIDIAKHLSRPKGEIELILALRPRRAG